MSSPPLDNLVRSGGLKKEPPARAELEGLIRSGRARLADAHNGAPSRESRFDLAYNAAHALSLAALRWHGYRSGNRYLVFQALPHTLRLEASQWRILDRAHAKRNAAEYEGYLDLDDALLDALLRIATVVEQRASWRWRPCRIHDRVAGRGRAPGGRSRARRAWTC